jgi:hypothetical protein
LKKLAIFVEGYTELLFVDALLNEMVVPHNILIEQRKIRGGGAARRTSALIKAASAASGQQYYVLLVDCGGDALVKNRIQEEHDGLSKKGYEKIIGIRDVRPQFRREDIPRLELGLRTHVKTSLIPVEFILGVMEVEAWFLAEFSHFERIDPAITVAAIGHSLGFDPENGDMSLREAPADDLNACYALAGKKYSKGDDEGAVKALDYGKVYLELPERIPYLQRFAASLDAFLTAAA